MTSRTLALVTPSTCSSAGDRVAEDLRTGRAGGRRQGHLDVDLVVVALNRIDQAQVDHIDVQFGVLDRLQGRDERFLVDHAQVSYGALDGAGRKGWQLAEGL